MVDRVDMVEVSGRDGRTGRTAKKIVVRNPFDLMDQLGKKMTADRIFDEVVSLVDDMLSSQFFQRNDEEREKIATLQALLDGFFGTIDILNAAQPNRGRFDLSFEHHVMWYSIYCEMAAKKTTSLRDLDRKKVMRKFRADLDSDSSLQVRDRE